MDDEEDRHSLQDVLNQQRDAFDERLIERLRADSERHHRIEQSDLWCGRFGISSRAIVFVIAAIISFLVVPSSIIMLFLYHDNCEMACTAVNLLVLIIGIWVPTPHL